MKIHTDYLAPYDLRECLGDMTDVYVYATPKGSRSRRLGYDAKLAGFGARHTRNRNGDDPRIPWNVKAATFSDWGRWLAALFARDPYAVCGPYKGLLDFHEKTFGLYSTGVPGNPHALALAVRTRVGLGDTKTAALRYVAAAWKLPEHFVKSAIFGE